LNQFGDFNDPLLVTLDGPHYFSFQKIHCKQCSRQTLTNGETLYGHRVITPVVVKPGQAHVLPLYVETTRIGYFARSYLTLLKA
jgi:hypothetical protein